MKTILIIIAIYIIFFASGQVKYTLDNDQYKIKYHGLLWVGLDYYTINKYHSTDMPMKWIEYSHTKIKE